MDEKKYNHHPAHGFVLKNEYNGDQRRVPEVKERLGPGRGLKHRAHCDECKQVSISLTILIEEHCWCQTQMFQMSRL